MTAPSPADGIDIYDEAADVFKRAREMFEEHSRMITGRAWDFFKADNQIKTIWILKASRARAEQEMPRLVSDGYDGRPGAINKVLR